MDCAICCQSFTSVLRKAVLCEQCKNQVCKQCIISWCKEKSNVVCPCCSVEFTYEFCFLNLGKSFMDKYRDVQKYVIFRQEQEFCKDTEIFIEIEKKIQESWKQYSDIDIKYFQAKKLKIKEFRKNDFIVSFFANAGEDIETMKRSEMNMHIRHYMNNIYQRFRNYKNAFDNGDITLLNGVDGFIVKKHIADKTLCPCPSEHCKGYIRSQTNKCGICDIVICRSCFVIKSDPHECNPDDVETVKVIMKDSKPCPRCGTRISKIDGCDQMYCIECKTAFSWQTGLIEKGRIHNPHYYEELRRNGVALQRDPLDRPGNCEDEPRLFFNDYSVMREELTNLVKLLSNDYHRMHRKYIHNRYMRDNQLRLNNNDNQFKLNYKLRLDYLKNKYTEEQFQKLLYKNFKKRKYDMEIHTEVSSYIDACKLILLTYYDAINKLKDSEEGETKKHITEIQNLRQLYNKLNMDLVNKIKKTSDIYCYKYNRLIESLEL